MADNRVADLSPSMSTCLQEMVIFGELVRVEPACGRASAWFSTRPYRFAGQTVKALQRRGLVNVRWGRFGRERVNINSAGRLALSEYLKNTILKARIVGAGDHE